MSNWLYIVIVNWNLREDTLACVNSLIEAGAKPDHIVVVDNASTDGSVEALKQTFNSELTIIESNQNLGFAAGSNLGAKFAIDQGAVWVLFLNNDTVVASNLLVELEAITQNYTNFSIIAPIIYYYDQPDIIWHLGDRLVPGTFTTINRFRGKKDPGNLPNVVPVDFVTGCGMMVRKDVFDRIGFFDSSFFMYAEEIDYCWRARQAGFRLACATQAKIWHRISTSASKDQNKSRYLRIRNQIYFYRRYASAHQVPLMFIFTLMRFFRLAFNDIIKRQTYLVGPLAHGWFDGWFKIIKDKVE